MDRNSRERNESHNSETELVQIPGIGRRELQEIVPETRGVASMEVKKKGFQRSQEVRLDAVNGKILSLWSGIECVL